MPGRILVALGAALICWLGVMHLRLTFVGDKLTPTDATLQHEMGRVSPIITNETTMWKAWLGFNASHSLGAILFGLVYAYLALAHPTLLFQSWFLLAVGAGLLGAYLWLGARYWFSAPFLAIGVASAVYAVGAIWGVISHRT